MPVSKSHGIGIPQNEGSESCSSNNNEEELLELSVILRRVCEQHGLPLGQTWSPCAQQRSEDINSRRRKCWGAEQQYCISIVESACYVRDERVLGFHQACSEHHLCGGQGVVGNAMVTNQPCFATNLSAYSKVDYPLSQHAKMFGIHGSIALRIEGGHHLRSYVLELLLLPMNCDGLDLHWKAAESLSVAVRSSRNFHLAAGDDTSSTSQKQPVAVQKEITFFKGEWRDKNMKGKGKLKDADADSLLVFDSRSNHDHDQTGFKLLTLSSPSWTNNNHNIVEFGSNNTTAGLQIKRKAKAQKTITMETLKQYFAGSLKDAARNIGVCPTTLKRICRQHGINRWPSRKIKKVGHSLNKLQHLMDSIQGGGQGQITFNFPPLFRDKPSESTTSSAATSHSFSTASDISPSTLLVPNTTADSIYTPPPDDSHKQNTDILNISTTPPPPGRNTNNIKVKAMFGQDKIRFTLLPNMGFLSLQQEIAKRFGMLDMSKIHIKYMDDDMEWVLMTCQEDLFECIDIHRASGCFQLFLHYQPLPAAQSTSETSAKS